MKKEYDINETNEMWKDIKESKREYKLKKQEEARKIIELLCGEYGIDFVEIKPYHFRLSQNGLRIDVYPQASKYHKLNSNQRGRYKSIEGFLYENFK